MFGYDSGIGLLDKFDKEMFVDTGMTMLGGAAAGVLVGVARAKIDFLKPTGTNPTMDMVKQVAVPLGVALLAGGLVPAQHKLLADGAIGAMGADVGMMLMQRFVPQALSGCVGCGTVGALHAPVAYPALQGARVHDEDVLGLRVNNEDTEEALAGVFGAGGMGAW